MEGGIGRDRKRGMVTRTLSTHDCQIASVSFQLGRSMTLGWVGVFSLSWLSNIIIITDHVIGSFPFLFLRVR
jgi:hypothetical protein